MAAQKHILLAGLGDLGQGLAECLLADGHQVSAIRRQQKAPAGVDVYAQDLVQTPAILLPPDQVDLLVIILTPASRDEAGYRDAFLTAPLRLVDALAKQQPLPPVIFVSSTAVFGDIEGEVNANTPPKPDSFRGKILLAAEEELSTRCLLSVVRFAGITGRSDYFANKAARIARGEEALPPNHWMNRIHRDDCIALLHDVAQQWLSDNTAPSLVIGTDNHPVASHQLYQQLAAEQGLELDVPDEAPTGKRILANLS